MPRLHPLRVQMSRSPRCHKVQGHTAKSGAGLESGLRLQAGSPAPSSPGHDGTREASPLADAAHAHSAGPGALHRGAHRTAAVVWCHGRPTPATSGAGRSAANPREPHSREEQVAGGPPPPCPSQLSRLPFSPSFTPSSPGRAGRVGWLECPNAPRETHCVP